MIGRVIAPARKIHMASGPIYIVLYEPRQRRQVTIPGPVSAFRVTILTGALENSSEFRRRLRACKQWFIGTLSLDSSKWMNKGGGETQQTYRGYTCSEDCLHEYLRSQAAVWERLAVSRGVTRTNRSQGQACGRGLRRVTALYITILLNARLYSRMRECQLRIAMTVCPSGGNISWPLPVMISAERLKAGQPQFLPFGPGRVRAAGPFLRTITSTSPKTSRLVLAAQGAESADSVQSSTRP